MAVVSAAAPEQTPLQGPSIRIAVVSAPLAEQAPVAAADIVVGAVIDALVAHTPDAAPSMVIAVVSAAEVAHTPEQAAARVIAVDTSAVAEQTHDVPADSVIAVAMSSPGVEQAHVAFAANRETTGRLTEVEQAHVALAAMVMSVTSIGANEPPSQLLMPTVAPAWVVEEWQTPLCPLTRTFFPSTVPAANSTVFWNIENRTGSLPLAQNSMTSPLAKVFEPEAMSTSGMPWTNLRIAQPAVAITSR